MLVPLALGLGALVVVSGCKSGGAPRLTAGYGQYEYTYRTNDGRQIEVEPGNGDPLHREKVRYGIETAPSYAGDTHLGASVLFLSEKFNEVRFLRFPTPTQSARVRVDTLTVMPFFFYTLGNRALGAGVGPDAARGAVALRVGVGYGFNDTRIQLSTPAETVRQRSIQPSLASIVQLDASFFSVTFQQIRSDRLELKHYPGVEFGVDTDVTSVALNFYFCFGWFFPVDYVLGCEYAR